MIAFVFKIAYAQRSTYDRLQVLYLYMTGILQHGGMIETFCIGSLYFVHGKNKQMNSEFFARIPNGF